VGPEALMGSTRMKAGTAQKLVLNMLSTGVFVRLHKVYSNLMVDVQATNEKLVQRSRRIIALATGCSVEQAERELQRCGGEVKTAIVARLAGLEPAAARALLGRHAGSVRAALAAS
jgi:N-acetylmuramic acid 6-phosphate etherase